MSELILSPTPNWFTSQPIDICQKNGIIASSAISSIVITENLLDKYNLTIKDAHSKRIVALSFYNNAATATTSNLLASCSEDLEIKVWNVETGLILNQHSFHQNVPTCLDWLRLDQTDPILISCDFKGNIFKWNLNTNSHARYFPENKPITQIKSCSNKYITAVGYKHGIIVILDVKVDQMKILHKLKSHEDTINCLNWFPASSSSALSENTRLETFFKTNDLSSILCSSAEDGTIRFFCTNKGEQLQCYKAPGNSSTSASNNQDKQQNNKNKIKFVPLCWPNGSIIVSGSFKGELNYFDLLLDENNNNNSFIKWRSFSCQHADKAHKKIIYEIASYNNQIISYSLDRSINIWNLKTFKQEMSVSTLNGYIYSIISSPIDPNVLAISVGDSSVKFLNEKQNKKISKNFTNNINSEVTQVCWHPAKESIIAFGTKDGKVGIFDYMSNNKPAQYIFTSYNQSIYTLIWSQPIIISDEMPNESKLSLYSVADGRISQHNVQFSSSTSIVNTNTQTINLYEELSKLTIDQQKPKIEYGLTEFTVLSIVDNNSFYFMLGKFDGSIEIYKKQKDTNKIVLLCSLFNHQKLITCIKYNKQNNPTSERGANLIASGSNDFNIIIIDFDTVISDLTVNNNNNLIFGKYKHKLIGHKERITSLSWSRHDMFELLASSSYDGTVQIWNADTGCPIANYRGHSEKILCCLFSNNSSNIVYSGGEDYSLHKWKIDSQPNERPPEECKFHFGKQKKSKTTVSTNKNNSKSIVIENNNDLKEEFELESNSNSNNSEIMESVKAVKKTIKLNQKEIKSLLVLSSHGNKSQKSKLKDCYDLFEIIINDKYEFTNDEQINLFIFGDRKSCIKMLELEQAELKRLNSDKWWYLDVWIGNLSKIFHLFKEQNLINDLVFNLFQISQDSNPINTILFLNEYIDQLTQVTPSTTTTATINDQIHKAALYALANFNVSKAIEIYCSKNMYQYALSLAHLRLNSNDSQLNDILNAYAKYATFTGDYETSVMCYIRLNDFENAYKVLLRRNVKNESDTEEIIKKLLDKFLILMNK